ncbi:MAG: hypothetical protein ACI37T_03915 [Candidatus Gastranaerophilaceae bacterium]
MAILQMQKISIYALRKDRKAILETLQRKGVVEITDLPLEDSVFSKTDTAMQQASFNKNSAVAAQALEILEQYSPSKKSMLSSFQGRTPISTQEYDSNVEKASDIMREAYEILNLSKSIAQSKASVLSYTQRIESLKPWLNLDISMRFKGTSSTVAFIGTLPELWDETKILTELKLNSDTEIPFEVEIVSSNLFIPNGDELFALLNDINGFFNFKINISDTGIDGNVNLNKVNCKIIMLNNLPVVLNSGNIKIDNEKILLTHLDGYHGKNIANKLTFSGKITDYQKSFDTNIEGYVFANNEFVKDYLSKAAGVPLEMIGKTIAKIKFKMKNNKIDSSIIFRLIKGYDILIDGTSFSPVNYERACRADMVIEGNNFELKNLNYYIAEAFQAGVEAKPLIRVFGNFDILKNMEIKNLGFEITKPLPSEFLNVLIGQRVFRKGLISGNLEYINAKNPFLKGKLAMEKVRIPSQRLFIKKGELYTDSKNVNIIANGRFKRSGYNFDGHITNEMKLPVVVHNINLTIDNVNVEKLLESFNAQQPQVNSENKNEALAQTLAANDSNQSDNEEDGEVVFVPGLITIEKCALKIVKGVYKKINFGNVIANMTLSEDGVFEIHSNKFDIAEGISTANVVCDLKNQKYKIRLGIKDVDSNAIAESLLNLPREISGKARGLIVLETDSSMKLNGLMKFDIKNGTIAKIGLVQYALNFVSLFRNPLAMISPATVMDLVNIPEGTFDDISGSIDIKDNVLSKILIKSSAPQLSTFIAGRFDLENSDATLRIYTKFSNKHKGLSGIMRKISLNALANRVPLNSRNDSNYYSAEISMLPPIDADEKDCQVFLTKVDGDVEHNNFLSSLKRIK